MQTPINPTVAELVDLLNADLREAFEERAGILEFDAGYPKDHAECLALIHVLYRYPEAAFELFKRI